MAGYDDWKASILPEQMEGKTLDAGFGTGFASNIAAERGSQVTAIEPHVDGIECSKLRPIHNGSGPSNIRWYRASVYNCSQFGWKQRKITSSIAIGTMRWKIVVGSCTKPLIMMLTC